MSRGWKSGGRGRPGGTRRIAPRLAALALAAAVASLGCGGAGERRAGGTAAREGPAPQGGSAREARSETVPGALSAEEARAFIAQHPEALVLDVRNPDEWNDALGHIESARQIPLPQLRGRLDEIAEWKEKPVIAVCAVGARSASAADLLARSGFREVYNLEGGMMAWRGKGY